MNLRAREVAQKLAFTFFNVKSGQCNPSLEKIGEACRNASRDTARRAISTLESAGFLHVIEFKGRGRSQVYILKMPNERGEDLVPLIPQGLARLKSGQATVSTSKTLQNCNVLEGEKTLQFCAENVAVLREKRSSFATPIRTTRKNHLLRTTGQQNGKQRKRKDCDLSDWPAWTRWIPTGGEDHQLAQRLLAEAGLPNLMEDHFAQVGDLGQPGYMIPTEELDMPDDQESERRSRAAFIAASRELIPFALKRQLHGNSRAKSRLKHEAKNQ